VRSRWLDIGQVLFCVFMDRDGVEVHKHAKKERGQYPAILTEQAWSITHMYCSTFFRKHCKLLFTNLIAEKSLKHFSKFLDVPLVLCLLKIPSTMQDTNQTT